MTEQKRNVMRSFSRAIKDAEQAQAKVTELTTSVVEGRATLGTKLADLITQNLGRIDLKAIDRYLEIQELLGVCQGELILICRNWTEEVATLHGGPIGGNQSHTHVYTDLVLGIIKGKRLRINEDEGALEVGLVRYVAQMPRPARRGSGKTAWELFEGNLDLNLAEHGVRAEDWPSGKYWDWSLPLEEKIDTTGFRGTSTSPQMSTFPEQPLKLSIAIGNDAVDEWLIKHNALLRLTGLEFDKAFELLRRDPPPKTAAKLESMRQSDLAILALHD